MQGYWKELYAARWVIVAITVATFALFQLGMLDRFETAGLDTLNILQAPKDPSHVVIVGITEQDYTSRFHQTSPLDPKSVESIIAAIANARPSVIGIDLDTSSDAFKELKTSANWPSVVWARDGIWNENTKTFRRERVLGGADPAREKDDAGLAAMPLDSDGIVRRFARYLPSEGGVEPSFAWSVVRAACRPDNPMRIPACAGLAVEEISEEKSKEALQLNFASQRFNFEPLSAELLLEANQQPQWQTSSPLRGKIVLLGGFYHAARDVYTTPVGSLDGVKLVSQAIETEFSGGGIRSFNELVMVLLDLASGALLVFISYCYPHHLGKALSLSLLSLVVVPPLFSFIAFSTLGRWFNFVPMIVGVLMHELYEHGREYHHLREKMLVEERARVQEMEHVP
jgi:CHASE2 domain-containing sensor protein